MAILDSIQFSQLVQEVRESLLAGSQGVGEVEVVTSLTDIVSLPALRLVGALESVVEAPLELLSVPAVEAAAEARKATEEAVVAAVNAEAAADLSEAERKELASMKEEFTSFVDAAGIKGDKAYSGAMNAENATLYALYMASYLQTGLEQAQVIILSGQAGQDVLESMSTQVQDTILVCAGTREEADEAILQLQELQAQVAQAIHSTYNSLDDIHKALADADQSIATAVIRCDAVIEKAEKAGETALFSASGADNAANHATRQAYRAKQHADNPPRVGENGYWWYWSEEQEQYEDSGKLAKGNIMFATFDIDPATGKLSCTTDEEYNGASFSIENGDLIVTV